MVNTPAFEEACGLARDRASTLGVGLHLNLLTGRPLTPVPTLSDPRTGELYSLLELARRAFTGLVSGDDVRRECDAQLAALLRGGVKATHIDSHRHTHGLPGILPAVLASARSAGVRVVRRPLERMRLSDPVASAKMSVLHASWRAAMRRVPEADRGLVDRRCFAGLPCKAPRMSRRGCLPSSLPCPKGPPN